ncbi:P-loop containing nucleoside triphosphate hydrolase protein [Linderina pennispora]|uniref:p-loop containing nucleoside triphosphate hydrolase protein n=1 Tax=Linderina pennispora TaxID=61395 RepID=A0A1Y1WBY2_9FUNG|nr:P-loop containing nucleoside triphosphate hydrolase protein [Linderina pennispora]ORX70664.1 P-loop containing nucleoside triphosphate hydrolase protein [Linderina pennispora]
MANRQSGSVPGQQEATTARFVVALGGVPGSGKSYLSERIVDAVNAICGTDVAMAVSMDGFHLTKQQLLAMDNPKLAMLRRGAPWTFDACAFVDLVKQLREHPDSTVLAPSFDHAVGDPKQNDIAIEPRHRIVVIEGLYAHVNEMPWLQAHQYFDESWWVCAADEQVCYERLISRHVAAGLAADRTQAVQRISANDAYQRRPSKIIYN